jgi:hypothetical protein
LFNRHLAKRVDRIEATQATDQLDTAGLILAARGGLTRPQRTVAVLEQLAQAPGLAGRLAKADLRVGRVGTSTAPIEAPERELAQQMGEFFADPLGFVMWAFPWSEEPALRVVALPAAYQAVYGCEHGPEAWALEFFQEIAQQVRARNFDGRKAVDAIREAVASGHGISKSATTAMLVSWIMSTRPDARGVITASTAVQLESKTWAEILKWSRRCITGHWWTVTTGRGSMRMMRKDRPEAWRCDAQTAREESAESFAGLHAASSTPFYVFDESSGVPDPIFEVAQGGLTDGEPMLFAFGNPTKNTGWFHAAFHAQRHRWSLRQIDSRQVSITNKKQLQDWIDDFGLDSDFVKVRVRGIFPSQSSLQFIGRDLVDEAAQRELPESRGEPAVVGVDPARFGDDASVIWTRMGRDGRSWAPIRLRQVDTMQLAARVAEHINALRSLGKYVICNIDAGAMGAGVIDRLRALEFEVNEIAFGSKATDPKRFRNKRAEMWSTMRDWLKGGAIPADEELATDLTGVEFFFTDSDQVALEKKESLKARGLPSPDNADALALTFAMPTPLLEESDGAPRWDRPVKQRERFDWDPIERFERHQRKEALT